MQAYFVMQQIPPQLLPRDTSPLFIAQILYRMEHDKNTLQRAVASPLDENAYLASEAQYRATFLLANDYYARLLGVECDLKCKNSTRLCGLAHDPELFFNPDALPFRAEVVPKIRKRMRNYRLERAVTTARKELGKHPLLPNCLKPFGLQKISKIGKRG